MNEIQPQRSVGETADNKLPLAINDDDRYSRLEMIGWWDQQRLRESKVIVVGAGALGNEVIKNLALVGIGQMLILDFDLIETSNLTRAVLFRAEHRGQSKAEVAARAARELNPDCRIEGRNSDVTLDLGLGVVRDANVVIGCVDNREARLWINRMCWKVNTPWIDGGIQEINGVVKTFVPNHGACYECTMTENDYRLMHLRYSCPMLKRDDMQQGKVPTAPTIASLIGALQTQEALKILHGRPVGPGVGMVFNGDANRFYQTRFPVREGCLSHESYDEITELDWSSQQGSLREFCRAAQTRLGWRIDSVELDRDFLLGLVCESCNTNETLNQPMAMVSLGQAACPQCGLTRRPDTICQVGLDDDVADLTLSRLGVPLFDVIKVKGEQRTAWVLLNKDRPKGWTQLLAPTQGALDVR